MAKLSDSELSSTYGWALATLNSNPDLKKLFQRAVSKQYTPERFIAEMRSTKWFKGASEAQRKYLVLKTADPAQYVSQVNAVMSSLADQYSTLTGEVLKVYPPTLKGGKLVGGKGFLFDTANSALQMGLNEAQIKEMLFKTVDFRKQITQHSLGGTSSGMLQQMQQQAFQLGVKPTESWYADQLHKTALGNDTPEGALGRLKELSAQKYGAFADRIRGGETINDISEGYRQSMARVLEINPGSIDVFDPQVQGALTSRNGEGVTAPKSINQFEDDLRKDNRWQFTQNAKETLMTTGASVLKSFGLSA